MSREGRRRFVVSLVRSSLVFAVIVGIGLGGWQVFRAMQETAGKTPAASAAPLSAPKLETTGYLAGDPTWLFLMPWKGGTVGCPSGKLCQSCPFVTPPRML